MRMPKWRLQPFRLCSYSYATPLAFEQSFKIKAIYSTQCSYPLPHYQQLHGWKLARLVARQTSQRIVYENAFGGVAIGWFRTPTLGNTALLGRYKCACSKNKNQDDWIAYKACHHISIKDFFFFFFLTWSVLFWWIRPIRVKLGNCIYEAVAHRVLHCLVDAQEDFFFLLRRNYTMVLVCTGPKSWRLGSILVLLDWGWSSKLPPTPYCLGVIESLA